MLAESTAAPSSQTTTALPMVVPPSECCSKARMVLMAGMVSTEGMVMMGCLVQKGKRETQEFKDPQGHVDHKVYKKLK